jgi:4-alpha-glucanotransferase
MMGDFLTAPHWARVGIRHHHGICVPLGSLITPESAGIGEYLDLLSLIEWLPSVGFDVLQLLPIHDTGDDPSPYMGLSAHALHPVYLSVRALPEAASIPGFLSDVDACTLLNTTPRVCYGEVLREKLRLLSVYLDSQLDTLIHDPAFIHFCKENAFWLTPYSIFRSLKKAQGGIAWWDWDLSLASAEADLSDEIMRWRAIQYLCFLQFSRVRAAADANGVFLVGDTPILINKDSADVWHHPNLFVLSKDVGAPPDRYNPKGQQWGFPLYRWSAHRESDFQWWKGRLRLQETLFHMYRLDHLVGFFRLYAIPPGQKASAGTFVPATPNEWKALGTEVLSMMVRATTMLPLGEDLGNVPDLVRQTMLTLGIPGLKVLRWERRWHTDGSFIPPSSFFPESVTTVSTHDSSTVCGWWAEEPAAAKASACDYGLSWSPTCTPALLSDILSLSHRSGSLFHINLLNEYLALFPELSWNDPEFERINRPGTLDPLNWTYRTRAPLHTILGHAGLRSAMRAMSGGTPMARP